MPETFRYTCDPGSNPDRQPHDNRENQNGKKKTARHTVKSCENSPKKPDTVKNDIDIPKTLESLKRAISIGFEKTFDYMGIQDRKTQETEHSRQPVDVIQEQEQRKSPDTIKGPQPGKRKGPAERSRKAQKKAAAAATARKISLFT